MRLAVLLMMITLWMPSLAQAADYLTCRPFVLDALREIQALTARNQACEITLAWKVDELARGSGEKNNEKNNKPANTYPGLSELDTLKISAEVQHDHDRFVLGAPYGLRINISNQSDKQVFVPLDEISVHIPKELRLGRTDEPEAGVSPKVSDGRGELAQDAGNEPKTKRNKIAECYSIPKEALVAIPGMKSNVTAIAIPPSGRHTLVWSCPPEFGSFLTDLFYKATFRPGEYTFIVNVPFYRRKQQAQTDHPLSRKANLRVTTILQADDSGKTVPASSRNSDQEASTPQQTENSSKTEMPNDQADAIMKSAEAEIRTSLDSLFIAICASVGSILASFVRFQFRRVELRSNQERYSRKERTYFIEKNRHDFAAFLAIGLVMTPLFITAANATQKFDNFVSIQIFDTFGAVLSGFIFHTIVIRFGEPAIDWFLKRVFGAPERDIINWH